ncbi:ABC transporter permease [Phenylobacterium sp.]|uniref:ABC transporter permease n=1 Tax=Phenylobacterium sp. TaxID=1871053 RepID=UPI0027374083|nr:ABC transporter permease [Phenylobacterium sp.]MDP3659232.1 ABC transporter permease [Phenylobacterium sp.]
MNARTATSLAIAAELPRDALGVPYIAAPVTRRAQARGERRLSLGEPVPFGWLLGPFLLVLYWSVGSASGLIDPRVLPAPWVAVTTAIDLIEKGRLQADLAVSTLRAAQGLAWGVAVGLLVALVSGLSLLGGYLFDGLVQVKRAIPTLALIPLLILWFGIGETMKVTVIALGVFIPIYIHTHNALRGIDLKYVELAETIGLSRWGFVRHVVLPGALPGFMLGLRFGVMGAWLALVVVEQLNATSGIGYMINLARTYAQSDVIVVGLVVYALLGLSSDAAVRALEARALRWRRTLGR